MRLRSNNTILIFRIQQSRTAIRRWECLFHISRSWGTISAGCSSMSLCWMIAKYDISLWSKIFSRQQADRCRRISLNVYWEGDQLEYFFSNFTQSLPKKYIGNIPIRHDQFLPNLTLSMSRAVSQFKIFIPSCVYNCKLLSSCWNTYWVLPNIFQFSTKHSPYYLRVADWDVDSVAK